MGNGNCNNQKDQHDGMVDTRGVTTKGVTQ